MATVRCRRPAMATWFEAWLVGDDPEHLSAVGEAALDEIDRVERLLSRHDPAAEVARVNREAARRAVQVDFELFAVLVDCLSWFERTRGAFDIGRTVPQAGTATPLRPLPERLVLSPNHCSVRFTDDSLTLDLGGYGKGYALDGGARVFEEFGVDSALIHGGTSSVLARGVQENGHPWRVGVADPFDPGDRSDVPHPTGSSPPIPTEPRTARSGTGGSIFDAFGHWSRNAEATSEPGRGPASTGRREIGTIALFDRALSTSAVRHPGAATSDLIDPTTGIPLDELSACVVLAPRAVEAEVLSTALLVMGEARAGSFLDVEERRLPPDLAVAWIGPRDGRTRLRWIKQG